MPAAGTTCFLSCGIIGLPVDAQKKNTKKQNKFGSINKCAYVCINKQENKMKKEITFLILFILATLGATAQCKISHVTNVVMVGAADTLQAKARDGVFLAQRSCNANQLAIVAGRSYSQVYYVVYSSKGELLTAGTMSRVNEGDFKVIDLHQPATGLHVVFGMAPLLAYK